MPGEFLSNAKGHGRKNVTFEVCTAVAKLINNQKVRVLENLISSSLGDDNSARVFVSQTVTNMMLGNLIVLLIGFVSFVLTLDHNNRVVTTSIFPVFRYCFGQMFYFGRFWFISSPF